jgi:pseudouridine synthase
VRPGRRPSSRAAEATSPTPTDRSARRSTAGPEDRPARRTPTGPTIVRRPAAPSDARPARRPSARTAEAGSPLPTDRPARRSPSGPVDRPARRAPARSFDRPANRPTTRPSTAATAKPKAVIDPTLPKAAPRPIRPGEERLQKILAAAGIASRRACEELILAGAVQVNGKTITELGTRADPRRDEITVNFEPIQREAPVYILMNKPKGYVTTVKDEQGRPTVMALLQGVEARVYPVGRLDFNSEGLLLMTNDGALAQVLMGPEHEIPKVYLVKVHRNPKPELIKEFEAGFLLSGRRLKPCHIEVAEKGDNPWLKVTLTEGKNLQIRRMFAAVGHPVSKLRRVQFGPLADPFLKPGTWRFLSPQEIAAIKSL